MPKHHALTASVPTAPLRVNASLPLLVRLEQLVKHEKKVRDPANVEELHEMRMATKWLRYTLEIFASAVEDADGALQNLKHLQHLLGLIHDTDILMPLLEEHLCCDGAPPGLQALYGRLRGERSAMYDEFLAAWDAAVEDGFPIRLWNAALGASAPPDAPAHETLPKERLLPPKRVRRVDISIALLRLVPYAAATASPETERRLLDAMAPLERAAADPEVDDKEWREATAALCALIGGAAAQ